MRRAPPLLLFLWLAGWGVPSAAGEEVVNTAEDGTVLERYEVDEAGLRHGRYAAFHPDGTRAVESHYLHGKRDGLEQTWDEHGTLRTAQGYKDDLAHGAQKVFDEAGRLRLQQTWRHGVLHGGSKSYHENRRLHVVATWREGTLQGKWTERTPDGSIRTATTYDNGLLHGTWERWAGKARVSKQVWDHGRVVTIDDVVPFPRSQEALRATLAGLLAGPLPGGELAADRELALRQLKAYRFLSGVAYEDLVLDAAMDASAQAAAEICRALGRITHEPSNPGWDAGRYAVALEGARSSNLHQGHRACTSVRGYMDDSDPTNVTRLGHRSWCLNPAMRKTGFGHDGGFTAMWSTDDSRTKVEMPPFVAVPPAGYVPGPWFGAHWAWSVALDPKRFDPPTGPSVKPVVEPVGVDFLPSADALALEAVAALSESRGVPYVVIFRPIGISLEAGRRYRVRIEGLTWKGKPKPLRWYVEFFELPYERPVVPEGIPR